VAAVVVDLVGVRRRQLVRGEGQHRAGDLVVGVAGVVDDRVAVGAADRDHRRVGDRHPVGAMAGQGVGGAVDVPAEVGALDVGQLECPVREQ
jgi:hypothetical protein